jgi:hypothetical protein
MLYGRFRPVVVGRPSTGEGDSMTAFEQKP